VALGDVGDEGVEAEAAALFGCADRDLDRELAAIRAQRRQLQAPADHAPLPALQVARQTCRVRGPVALRDDQRHKGLTHRGGLWPSEDPLRRTVPRPDGAKLADRDVGVVGGLQHVLVQRQRFRVHLPGYRQLRADHEGLRRARRQYP